MKLNFAALIIVSLCPFVNGQEAPKPTSEPRENTTFRELSFDEFVKQVLTTDSAVNISPGYAKVIGVPQDAKSRGLEVRGKQCVDNLGRFTLVILAPASTPQDYKPIHLFFSAGKRKKDLYETHEFRASLTGVLERAFISRMKLDGTGKGVRGSAVPEPLDINSPKVKTLFQRELDFWLKGKGRKQTAEARAESDMSKTTPAPKADKAPAAGAAASAGKP